MTASRIAAAIIACLLTCSAAAQWKFFESDFDDQEKPWKEIEAKLPAYPKAENLLDFDGGSAAGHKFFVDAPSLSIGEDGVVRYSLVVRTAGGATNVSYEGIRCDMRQQKVYAIGRAGGTWARARDPQWRRIEYREVSPHYGVLYVDFLCRNNKPVPTVREMIDAFKYGRRD